MIDDDNHKRMDWSLGKIEKLFGGRDGNVRVVMLKTKEERLKRPIRRIYPLEISQNKLTEMKNIPREIQNEMTNDNCICENDNKRES